MTNAEMLAHQLAGTAKMLDLALDAVPHDQTGARSNEKAMSAGEMVAHLTECYAAYLKHTEGQSHEWGSYQMGAEGFAEQLAELRAKRAEAHAAATASDERAQDPHVFGYLIHHDHYHLGQLVTLLLNINPEWDDHSIYA